MNGSILRGENIEQGGAMLTNQLRHKETFLRRGAMDPPDLGEAGECRGGAHKPAEGRTGRNKSPAQRWGQQMT